MAKDHCCTPSPAQCYHPNLQTGERKPYPYQVLLDPVVAAVDVVGQAIDAIAYSWRELCGALHATGLSCIGHSHVCLWHNASGTSSCSIHKQNFRQHRLCLDGRTAKDHCRILFQAQYYHLNCQIGERNPYPYQVLVDRSMVQANEAVDVVGRAIDAIAYLWRESNGPQHATGLSGIGSANETP